MVTRAWTLRHLALIITLALNLVSVTKCLAEAGQQPAAERPHIIFPKSSLSPDELGIVANRQDPVSVEIARYYAAKRDIPASNIYQVSFDPALYILPRTSFEGIYDHLSGQLPAKIQALVLTWTKTYRVDCMSITSAFTLGFSEAYCANGCKPTKPSPYFDSKTVRPYDAFRLRPTMMLAGNSADQIKALIDRGISADATHPPGTAYLVKTSDPARNTRAYVYEKTQNILGHVINIERIDANYIENKHDVLFYFTGLTTVPSIETNRYVPGAIADHLTSAGGVLSGSSQMSILRWLEAGATGSYGAVVEPCNFPQKFPNPGVVVSHYTRGETLLEAYWKSVEMPGQGLFVGEPLARPFGGYFLKKSDETFVVSTYSLVPGRYTLLKANNPVGPYRAKVTQYSIMESGIQHLSIPRSNSLYFKLAKDSDRSYN
jgi:uncharacterized protein (TIGR03790 family)